MIVRQPEGLWKVLGAPLAIALVVLHLYTGLFGVLPSYQQIAVHVGLAVTLVFLLYPARKSSIGKASVPIWDLLLILLMLVSVVYILTNFLKFMVGMAVPPTTYELILAVVTALLILEAARRSIGIAFPILTLVALAYALWGHLVPGLLGHAPVSLAVVLEFLYMSPEGIWGFLTGLSARYVAVFIIFGALMVNTGGGRTFIDLTILITGRFRGGPAKVSVVASGFFAMLSGSSGANVATTGAFTFPTMKRLGYSAEFAGGVEAASSTAGVLTPPIMGAAAFIMAELLGIPYLKVAIAAAIPALLFYVAAFMGVHFEAVKKGLAPIPRQDMPPVRSVITWSKMLGLFLPILVLLYMMVNGYSLPLVGASASAAILVLYILRSPHSIKERLWNLPRIFDASGRTLASIAPMLVAANILYFCLHFTGLDFKLATMASQLAEGNLVMALVMTGILVMILGCGLPSAAAYILGAIIAAPLLISWGIMPIAAHLFVLYYAVTSNITPPVCPAVFVAAHIAQSNWLRTAWVAMRIAPLIYFMPFVFIFDPSLILIGTPGQILLSVGTAIIGAIVLVSGTMGYFVTRCHIIERLLLAATGLLLVTPILQADIVGVFLLVAITSKQLWQRRRIR